MTTTTAPPGAPLPVDIRPVPPTPVPALDVVVPVFNEEGGLESCLRRLHAHLATEFPYRFRITVADNASTDGTLSGLSARIFGMSSWSLLVPQALCGVGAVGLLYGAVRRWSGPVAGLLAGAALAVTPAAALMFRFDNPDALLTLLLIAGAYCMVRAVEAGRTTWILLAGTALGFAFLTKMLQAFLVLPAFALVYLVAAPVTLRRRIGQVLAAGLAVLVSAGWWVLAVALWPSAPYIGGSTDGTVLNLVFGYNGFGRIFGGDGNGGGGGGGGPGGSSFGGPTGLSRLFSSEMGAEVSWLLPAALRSPAGCG